jgi:hypothetical protein
VICSVRIGKSVISCSYDLWVINKSNYVVPTRTPSIVTNTRDSITTLHIAKETLFQCRITSRPTQVYINRSNAWWWLSEQNMLQKTANISYIHISYRGDGTKWRNFTQDMTIMRSEAKEKRESGKAYEQSVIIQFSTRHPSHTSWHNNWDI